MQISQPPHYTLFPYTTLFRSPRELDVDEARVMKPALEFRAPEVVGRWRDELVEHDPVRSEEHTSELQSRSEIVCRLLLEKKTEEDSKRTKQAKNLGSTSKAIS